MSEYKCLQTSACPQVCMCNHKAIFLKLLNFTCVFPCVSGVFKQKVHQHLFCHQLFIYFFSSKKVTFNMCISFALDVYTSFGNMIFFSQKFSKNDQHQVFFSRKSHLNMCFSFA